MFSTAPFSGWVEFSPGFSPRRGISHVVFDFDGTLSWLRHGWPDLMYRLFREHIPARPRESEPALHERLLSDILSLNGKPSIQQMELGAARITEAGGLKLEPHALLVEYQRRLDRVIRKRTQNLARGVVERDEFLVHGARTLLEELHGRRLKLVILSGTIEHRVKEEAALLDVARYFGAHIYGGTADLAQSSKHAVLDRLLREEKIIGEHLLCFGDGPVETQLAKALGGLAVAVASDEEHNGSGQFHPQKAPQLREAGADVLIPDYRDANALLDCVLT
jgi:phosphoglycolate phosphatase-like HAD superfamily hydrolase